MRILITHLAPEATEDELKALLMRYGFPPPDSIQRFPDANAPVCAIVEFRGALAAQLEPLADRVQGVNWKGHALEIEVLPVVRDPRREQPTKTKHG